jgi:hypothetical protein
MAKKLPSGALQFTVFMAVLIALLLSGLILYAYSFLYFKEQSKAAIQNIQVATTGIDYLLTQNQVSTDTLLWDGIQIENQSIKLHLSYWGIFQKAVVCTTHRKKVFKKVAIIGAQLDAEKSPTLYLQETYNPLTVVGTTRIKGIAYLPSQGIKPGYISGQSYYGTQLVEGKIEKSTLKLPSLSQDCLSQLRFYKDTYKPINQADFINSQTSGKIVNSFKKNTKGIYLNGKIVLGNNHISGNIIIKSDSLIKVAKDTQLKDVILIAPIIEIEAGTIGNFQAIASKKIIVGKNCQLNYPSALVLCQDNKSNTAVLSNEKKDNQIFIDTESIVMGSVCYFQTNESPTDFNTQIVLEEKARIKGLVYCQGSFELKGTVSGAVYTRQFMANQAGSIFVNHIFNGVIENEKIPKKYGGIVFENGLKTVMKWMY